MVIVTGVLPATAAFAVAFPATWVLGSAFE